MNNPNEAHNQVEEQSVEELFLLHLRYKESQLVQGGGNAPILLNDPTLTRVVYRGSADLFAVRLINNLPSGERTHLMRLQVGQAAFAIDPLHATTGIGLLLVPTPSSQLLVLSSRRLQRLAFDADMGDQVIGLLNTWIERLSAAVVTELPPKNCQRTDGGKAVAIAQGDSISARHDVLWMRHIVGRSQFTDASHLPHLNGTLRWPISQRGWVQATEDSEIDLINTREFIEESPEWADLGFFHEGLLTVIESRISAEILEDEQWMLNKLATDRVAVTKALNNLAAPLHNVVQSEIAAASSKPPLLAALEKVAAPQGIEVKEVPPEVELDLDAVARVSGFQIRRVSLKGTWWRHDHGAILGAFAETDNPVALLPDRRGRYLLYDAQTDETYPVTDTVAATLSGFGHVLYRSFPTGLISTRQLFQFGFNGNRRDLRRILITGLAVALLGLLIPVATGTLIDRIIPQSDLTQLWQMGTLLVAVVVAVGLFQLIQNLSMLRMQSRMGAELQAAIWDRVLTLPVSFFRSYSAGDLGNRVLAISHIQQALSGTALGALLAGVMSIFSFGLLVYYHTPLAIVALVLVLVSVSATVLTGIRQVRYQREYADLQGEISGNVLQSIKGIAKFRASGVEGRAFAEWGAQFGRSKQINLTIRSIANRLMVFDSAYQVVISLVVFAMVMWFASPAMTIGRFLAFYAAFLQFALAISTVGGTVVALMHIIPLYERARPLLDTLPEIDQLKKHPGTLRGNIEVSHVSFRYQPDGPLILKDVSIQANEGEFVALVGSSGSGKSTLFRVLLGFEQPDTGVVHYDNHALDNVDIRELRRQIGVVLQNGQIMAGDIFTNIVGSRSLTLDDAWRAAAMAGLAQDIADMPMQMHTMLSQGGGTLSGGQRQRLLIARAIVNRPRILFFDEATSALDSKTQQIVSESLEGLQATRIVIAHRLSTIMNADRIYVLDNGRVVESGTYDELMRQDQLFATFARRQLVNGMAKA